MKKNLDLSQVRRSWGDSHGGKADVMGGDVRLVEGK